MRVRSSNRRTDTSITSASLYHSPTKPSGTSFDPNVGHFYEAACQVTSLFVGDRSHFGHTSTERAQPLQPARECARERVRIRTRRQALFLAERDSEVTHPFIRALRGTPRCRRTIRSEGGVAQSTGRLSEAAKCPSALTPPA